MTTKTLDIKVNQSIVSILGRKLYSSQFGMVVLRELIQNSLDANASKIEVWYDSNQLILEDNGDGIQKIEGLLDTIGESIKGDSIDVIGGYGLAKLAIFGCKFWKFQSISGTFQTGYVYNPDDRIPSGTKVVCQFEDNDFGYYPESKIQGYLKNIARNCQFFYNGDLIEQPSLTQCTFGYKSEIIANTNDNGYAVIRVNGLPTFTRYIRNLTKTIYLDYRVNTSPYDANYPLTSNRDSFIETSNEYQDMKTRIDAIEEKLESDKKLEENLHKQDKIIKWRNEDYIGIGDITKQDFNDNALLITTYKRYIKQIGELTRQDMDNTSYGLTDGSDGENGAYSKELSAFVIRKGITNKGMILSIALHEYIHFMGYGTFGHDQSFASQLTEISGIVLNALLEGQFRK